MRNKLLISLINPIVVDDYEFMRFSTSDDIVIDLYFNNLIFFNMFNLQDIASNKHVLYRNTCGEDTLVNPGSYFAQSRLAFHHTSFWYLAK